MNLNIARKKILLDSEKAKLFDRITVYVGHRLSYLVSKKGGWKSKELYEHLGIPGPRQTEYRNFEKYNRRINEKDLALCLGGGIVTTKELIDNCAETDMEKKFLATLNIYEDRGLKTALHRAMSLGLNVREIINKACDDAIKNKK